MNQGASSLLLFKKHTAQKRAVRDFSHGNETISIIISARHPTQASPLTSLNAKSSSDANV
jgi:hypothetical protein